MIERIGIVVALVIIGFILYRALQWWSLRRTEKLQAKNDPLLAEFHPGRPGILLFTADFCSTCKLQQIPALYRLTQEIGRDNIQIIEVDAEQKSEDAQRWGVMSLPTTFVLDQQGKPKAVNYGVASTEKLRQQLEQVG